MPTQGLIRELRRTPGFPPATIPSAVGDEEAMRRAMPSLRIGIADSQAALIQLRATGREVLPGLRAIEEASR